MTTSHDATIELFLAVRPYYDPQHVIDIADRCAKNNIPFCRTCADWHLPNEEHSDIEDSMYLTHDECHPDDPTCDDFDNAQIQPRRDDDFYND